MGLPSLVLSALASSASLAAPPDDTVGHWAGDLTFRGAALPVRLHVADADAVTLDIPDLIMAWEPVPTEPTADALRVTLPCGLGPLAVAFDEDAASAAKDVGGSTLSLELSRTSPPFHREPLVVTTDDDVTLVGELVVPDGDGPHPAVVLLHGSSNHGLGTWAYQPVAKVIPHPAALVRPSSSLPDLDESTDSTAVRRLDPNRTSTTVHESTSATDCYRSWADLLAREGFAVALYDKRGVGDSGGELGADLCRSADDAHSVFAALAAHPSVDAARVA